MAHDSRVHVHRTGPSFVDGEFGSMRSRFETEMRQVEKEMNRLRQEFEHRPRTNMPSVEDIRAHKPFPVPPEPLRSEFSDQAISHRYNDHLDKIRPQVVKEESDGKTLRLRFDVSQYAPEEIMVKTIDNRLVVRAVHEEKDSGRAVHREFNQDFVLPNGTNPEFITSSLSVDGILTVEAPLPQLAITGK